MHKTIRLGGHLLLMLEIIIVLYHIQPKLSTFRTSELTLLKLGPKIKFSLNFKFESSSCINDFFCMFLGDLIYSKNIKELFFTEQRHLLHNRFYLSSNGF